MSRKGIALDVVYPLEIDSVFPDVRYEIKAGHIIIRGGENGMLAVSLESALEFAKEIREIAETWGGVKT